MSINEKIELIITNLAVVAVILINNLSLPVKSSNDLKGVDLKAIAFNSAENTYKASSEKPAGVSYSVDFSPIKK